MFTVKDIAANCRHNLLIVWDEIVKNYLKNLGSWTTDTNLINGPKFFKDFIIKKIFLNIIFIISLF